MHVNIHQDNLGMERLKEVRRLHSCIHIHVHIILPCQEHSFVRKYSSQKLEPGKV